MNGFDDSAARRRERSRHGDGTFGEQFRGEQHFDVPDGGGDVVRDRRVAVAAATVPASVRDHARQVLGFVTVADESLREADTRLALEGRDRLGEFPGWGPDSYNMLAAVHVAETDSPLHPDDEFDLAMVAHVPGADELEDVWDSDVVAGYAREARELLEQMPDASPPF